MVSFISRVQILKPIFCINKIKVKHLLAGFYWPPFSLSELQSSITMGRRCTLCEQISRGKSDSVERDETENRARAGVCTHNGCLSYSKRIICFKVINRNRVYRHYIFYTLFSKTYLRWGFYFEPFKCLHHSHMNNTVKSCDVSIVQFIVYLTYRIKITMVYLYYVLEYNILSNIYENASLYRA